MQETHEFALGPFYLSANEELITAVRTENVTAFVSRTALPESILTGARQFVEVLEFHR